MGRWEDVNDPPRWAQGWAVALINGRIAVPFSPRLIDKSLAESAKNQMQYSTDVPLTVGWLADAGWCVMQDEDV